MTSAEIVFRDRYGLHPRAAMRIQQAVGGFRSRVSVRSAEPAGRETDARSMIALVSAGIRAGDRIVVSADGEDEEAALAAVRQLVETGVCHP